MPVHSALGRYQAPGAAAPLPQEPGDCSSFGRAALSQLWRLAFVALALCCAVFLFMSCGKLPNSWPFLRERASGARGATRSHRRIMLLCAVRRVTRLRMARRGSRLYMATSHHERHSNSTSTSSTTCKKCLSRISYFIEAVHSFITHRTTNEISCYCCVYIQYVYSTPTRRPAAPRPASPALCSVPVCHSYSCLCRCVMPARPLRIVVL
jgi:hypothetical protein